MKKELAQLFKQFKKEWDENPDNQVTVPGVGKGGKAQTFPAAPTFEAFMAWLQEGDE